MLHFRNWVLLFQELSWKERTLAILLFLVVVGALLFWIRGLYFSSTGEGAEYGGHFREGVTQQPTYINPLLSISSEADADLTRMIYSGLFKYDASGKLALDLAETYQVSEDNKTYTVTLRDQASWHDGEQVTAEDVIFTVKTLQNKQYDIPSTIRDTLAGVEVEKTDDRTVSFRLNEPRFGFLQTLTLGILPKHVWESVPADRFSLAERNLSPIGSGPYQFESIEKRSDGTVLRYELRAFREYQPRPYIDVVSLHFYPNETQMIDAYNRGEIDSIGGISIAQLQNVKEDGTIIHSIPIPRYFAIFFNQSKSVPLAFDEVRLALSYGTDRSLIVEQVLQGHGDEMYSPFSPHMVGYAQDHQQPGFNMEEANTILDQNNWLQSQEGASRQKDGSELKFTLLLPEWPEAVTTGNLLKEQWRELGVDVELDIQSISEINKRVSAQDYDALLFGQLMSFDPDPYAYWHSSRKKQTNIALYGDEEVDLLLENAQSENNTDARIALYAQFQEKLVQEVPAIFLASPHYIYPVSTRVGGVTIDKMNSSEHRLSSINEWFIKIKRIARSGSGEG